LIVGEVFRRFFIWDWIDGWGLIEDFEGMEMVHDGVLGFWCGLSVLRHFLGWPGLVQCKNCRPM
jgi:hypothetical protein